MRILFIVDGRSPIALNWIDYFLRGDHQVHLVSTYPCSRDDRLESFHVVPVAFSSLKQEKTDPNRDLGRRGLLWGGAGLRARTLARQWLGPLTLSRAAQRLGEILLDVKPDLVHAMRIPYEGMLAASAMSRVSKPVPLLVSVWGNDFTLHAPSNPLMRRYTRLALRRACGLHADCRRDIRLAYQWGYTRGKPTVVLPGGGGVRPDVFYPPESQMEGGAGKGGISEDAGSELTVINPRGFRAYIRNDVFFRAIPRVLERQPAARFICPAMAGEPQAGRWVDELGIGGSVELLPGQDPAQMAALFRRARVSVSPSTHDGTPNTLLEAMACGCIPVAGDLESLREWIEPGVNGLLVDPTDPRALAEGILNALEDAQLFQRSLAHNLRLVAERATYPQVMEGALRFYCELV